MSEGSPLDSAAAAPDHDRVVSNLAGALRSAVDGSSYAASVGAREGRSPDVLLSRNGSEATLIVEVLSPSTEAWDRGGQFQNYRQIDSLREYVMVASDKPLVETYLRQQDGTWVLNAVGGLEARARLVSLGVELDLAEVYSGVQFPAAGSSDSTT